MGKKEKQKWTITEAWEYASNKGYEVSVVTITTWVTKYKLGSQPGGNGTKIFVDSDKFKFFLSSSKKEKNAQNHK